MSKTRSIASLLVLVLVSVLLQREFARGTFDPVERLFVGWLSANGHPVPALPPLALVLYDDEASSVAGTERMGPLDVTLFARAAARVGAVAAGVEGLTGDPARMIEAAAGLPLFAAYPENNPPGTGWTPWAGLPGTGWPELPGLVGPASTRFPRGFFSVPEGSGGPRRVKMAARNTGRVVPSFLALSWAAAQRSRSEAPTADGGWLKCAKRKVPVDAAGNAHFFPADPALVLGMNDLLVAAEKFERDGGRAPLRGHLLVLARATAEVTRVKDATGEVAATPAELWAQAWHALRQGRFFVLPAWWYQVLVAAAALLVALMAGRRSWLGLLTTGLVAVLVYLLAALAAYASSGLLLPFVPSVGTLVAGLALGRLLSRP